MDRPRATRPVWRWVVGLLAGPVPVYFYIRARRRERRMRHADSWNAFETAATSAADDWRRLGKLAIPTKSIQRGIGSRIGYLGRTYLATGNAHFRRGELEQARTLNREAVARHRSTGRSQRLRTNHRARGSRRVTSRSAGGGSSGDPDDDPEPPPLRLWRHPKWGSVSPNLLRILLREERP